ncbi:hypothetical protein [Clostridium beijerinckii]|nr:hypothetical protein [Clostridium beijerinckii]
MKIKLEYIHFCKIRWKDNSTNLPYNNDMVSFALYLYNMGIL